MGADGEHARIAGERQAALDAILDSAAPKKLIVAGPGTCKTHTFKAALERAGQRSAAHVASLMSAGMNARPGALCSLAGRASVTIISDARPPRTRRANARVVEAVGSPVK